LIEVLHVAQLAGRDGGGAFHHHAMRTYVPMMNSIPPNHRGPLLGRVVLLGGAYAPAALIIGARTVPALGGWGAVGLGVIGIGVWSLFLAWLPHAQPREIEIATVEPADTEVTAYIASYLLPILAAASPTTGDIVAYAICGLLILIVAFAADLGSVNPVVYLFRLRVMRARVDGGHVIILVRGVPEVGTTVVATQALGVVLVL
jgi:hypothetical protein